MQIPGRPISIATSQVGLSIPVTPDGMSLFIVNGIQLYKVSNVRTSPTTSIFTVPGTPNDVAITPDQAPTASFVVTSAYSSGVATFDASASSSPVGSIASYTWNFGDGSPMVTVTNPVVQHQYAVLQDYTVTLTVTNTGGTSTVVTFTGKNVSNHGGPSAVTTGLVHFVPIFINPPTNFQGEQIANRFLTQTEFVNVLTWKPATGGEPAAFYNLYRDSALTDLIASVPGNKNKYEDHNRKKDVSYTYFIVAVDAAGNLSTPVSVTVNPKKK